jgi:hypothetical protein
LDIFGIFLIFVKVAIWPPDPPPLLSGAVQMYCGIQDMELRGGGSGGQVATFTKSQKFTKNIQLPARIFCKMIENITTKHLHTLRMAPELVASSKDLSSRSDHLLMGPAAAD